VVETRQRHRYANGSTTFTPAILKWAHVAGGHRQFVLAVAAIIESNTGKLWPFFFRSTTRVAQATTDGASRRIPRQTFDGGDAVTQD